MSGKGETPMGDIDAAVGRRFDAAVGRLDDYVRGAMDDAEVSGFEEDLFERALAGAAPELTFRTSLGATLRTMSARGTLDLWLTSAGVARLKASSNLEVVVFELDLERLALPEVPPGTDLLITRIPLDLRGVRRLEAEILTLDGRLVKLMPDIAFDPGDGAVYACCEADLARAASVPNTMTRVFAIEETERRLVLELPGF